MCIYQMLEIVEHKHFFLSGVRLDRNTYFLIIVLTILQHYIFHLFVLSTGYLCIDVFKLNKLNVVSVFLQRQFLKKKFSLYWNIFRLYFRLGSFLGV